MTKPSDRDYYQRRLGEEQQKQASAQDDATARIHAKLAEAYAQKLRALSDDARDDGGDDVEPQD